MLQLVSVLVLLRIGFSFQNDIDIRVITAVRNGLERSLNYIDEHLGVVNVDCLLGVSFSAALLKDAHNKDGYFPNLMEKSTNSMYQKAINILQKAAPKYKSQYFIKNGEDWKFKHIVEPEIWYKNMSYKHEPKLRPTSIQKTPISKSQKFKWKLKKHELNHPNTDFCLQNIANISSTKKPTFCAVDKNCYQKYFEYDSFATGYDLTHRLLLLQFAKQRKCVFDNKWYQVQSRKICSAVLGEVLMTESLNELDCLFDLFLEQVFLCGYEGYSNFFQNRWLYFVLKSQKPQGCFADKLTDDLKTRMKKDMNYFQDGCTDHSTGLGVAILALYYNFILTEAGEQNYIT